MLITGFGKARECKQFMEEVLHQTFPLKEGSCTLFSSFSEDGKSSGDHKSQNLLGLEGTFGGHPIELSCSKQGKLDLSQIS